MSLNLGYIGNSSLSKVSCIREKRTGRELAWNSTSYVAVDKTTRKPTQLSDRWRQKYEPLVVKNQKFKFQPLFRPTKTSNYEVKVRWEAVGKYKHANYLAYISFCLDAAMEGLVKGRLVKFHGDIHVYSYHVKKLQAMYRKETLAGDVLDVAVWQNTDNPFLLHFDISKNADTVFQCSMEFYDPGHFLHPDPFTKSKF